MVDLGLWQTSILNTAAWPILQVGISYLFIQFPETWFSSEASTDSAMNRREQYFLEKFMHVRRWKDLLPDGATWFEGGFPKARLQSHDEAYLRRFAAEARRGELAHAVMLCFIPLFFTYNPPWASAVMTVVGLVLNVPCLLTQRYNRHRLRSLLRNRRRHTDL